MGQSTESSQTNGNKKNPFLFYGSGLNGNKGDPASSGSPEGTEKTVLQMSGHEIHSLAELRTHFNAEDALKHTKNGTLYQWLVQHYYEREAAELFRLCPHFTMPDGMIRIPEFLKRRVTDETSDLQTVGIVTEDRIRLQRICEILGVPYEACITGEELERLNARRAQLKQYTEDETILNESRLAAFSQEELASLLDAGEPKIYLCQEHFSIPLGKPDIHYIGVGDPVIDNPYTAAQYRKAGITITDIRLPDTEDPDTADFARKSAVQNGYDDYPEDHSTLACAIHFLLKLPPYRQFYRLPTANAGGYHNYRSYSQCDAARQKCLRQAYDAAVSRTAPGDPHCVDQDAARFYGRHITSSLQPILDPIRILCEMHHLNTLSDHLFSQVSEAEEKLLALFREELQSNADYYAMYQFDYFADQVDIEEHDYCIEEEPFFHMLETLLTDHVEYHFEGAFAAIQEMEKDLSDHCATFFGCAHSIYRRYVQEIEQLVDTLGERLPAMEENETLQGYLCRLTQADSGSKKS